MKPPYRLSASLSVALRACSVWRIGMTKTYAEKYATKKEFTINQADAERVVEALEYSSTWDKTEVYYQLYSWLRAGANSRSRAGFYQYRKAYPEQRLGQAFCNYFELSEDQAPGLFNMTSAEEAKQVCEKLMDNWQTPEK
jgi:hypothetical protein